MKTDTISAQEARRLLRLPKPAFGWVNLHENDGTYIQLNKTHLLEIIQPDSQSTYQIKERPDGIYIN